MEIWEEGIVSFLIIEFKSCILHDGALLIMTLYNNIIILVPKKLVYEICSVSIYSLLEPSQGYLCIYVRGGGGGSLGMSRVSRLEQSCAPEHASKRSVYRLCLKSFQTLLFSSLLANLPRSLRLNTPYLCTDQSAS